MQTSIHGGSEFSRIKQSNFDQRRAPIYHYMVWANRYDGGGSSGYSFGIPASDFLVTLGGWGAAGGATDDQKIGTFLHELGHNLNLKHGGSDHTHNKPNHLSVMNYSFQTRGIRHGDERRFTYQGFGIPALHEHNLVETNGLGRSPDLLDWYTIFNSRNTIYEVPADGAIDWNQNGSLSSRGYSRNINGDRYLSELSETPDEWNSLVFGGGSIGSRTNLRRILRETEQKWQPLPYEELTEEQDKALNPLPAPK